MKDNNTWIRLPDRNVLVAIGIIMLSTFFDALRDGCSDYISWWAWHGIKWLSFYAPLAFIALEHLRPRRLIAYVAVAAWVLWSVALELTPATWHGSFIQLCLNVLEWLKEMR